MTEDDDFLERPILPVSHTAIDGPRLTPDDILLDRFRIIRLIGRGGMGEVYEAHDAALGLSVALKTIRSDIANDERVIAKFRSEVRQARTLVNPNVCRVYDLFTAPTVAGPLQFLTMELLTGEPLAERLARAGALGLDEAAAIATQIGGALDEAHARRIVHRDLKPGNVILATESGSTRAVVTDFGLAVNISEWESYVALSDRHAGTQAYVAPEQLATGQVGPAADVYAFGVVLHEMLTGRKASRPEEIDERIPSSWRAAIAGALATSPDNRLASASAVLAIAQPRPRQVVQPVLTILTLVALTAVALYPIALRFLSLSHLTPGALVVTDVVNETSDPEVAGITEMLRYQLDQSAVIAPLPQERVTQVLRQMVRPVDRPPTIEDARGVAWRTAASAIVSGRVRGGAPDYVVTLRLEARGARPDVVGRVETRSFEARDKSQLQRAVGAAARWVRARAGETASELSAANRPSEDVTSSSWQAVALFSRAQGLIAQSRENDALALLEEAVRLDSDFALAWMRLGDVLMSLRRSEEGYQRWERALEVSGRRQLAPREELRIRGMFASDTDDYGEAERVYRVYLLSFPNDFAPFFYIARPLLMLGRADEAIAMLVEAERRDPNAFSVPAQAAMFKLRAGRLSDASRDIARLRALGQSAWAECIQGQLDFLAADYASALNRFRGLTASDNPLLRARAPMLVAAVFADLGRTELALETLRNGIAADAQRGDQQGRADKLLVMAELSLTRGDRRACRDFCVQSMQIDHSPLRLARAAALLARADAVADADALLRSLPTKSRSRKTSADRARVEGEILLARGHAKAAWANFQRAASLEPAGAFNEFLARGAAAAGETGTAVALNERMASEPGYYWRYPDLEIGGWFNALKAYAQMSRTAPTPNTEALRTKYAQVLNVQLTQIPFSKE